MNLEEQKASCFKMLETMKTLKREGQKWNSSFTSINGLYGELLVLNEAIKRNLCVEGTRNIASQKSSDIRINNYEVEVKFSIIDYRRRNKKGEFFPYWEWRNINPRKFDFLVLVGEELLENFIFFIFNKKEVDKYIPTFDFYWNESIDKRSIRIYKRNEDRTAYYHDPKMCYKPRKEKERKIKEIFGDSDYCESWVNRNKEIFETKWEKFSSTNPS